VLFHLEFGGNSRVVLPLRFASTQLSVQHLWLIRRQVESLEETAKNRAQVAEEK
jgi:hypothetical protein